MIQQAVHDRGRHAEWKVREHAVALVGKGKLERVAVLDLNVGHISEASAQPPDERGMQLESHDPARSSSQLGRELAGARSDLDDEIVRADVSVLDEISSEASSGDEMPTARASRVLRRRVYRVHG
jgi:hypothetical protein